MPLLDGLSFVHNAIVGAGLRVLIRLGASGKIISGFDMARVMALGADYCNAARASCSRLDASKPSPVIPISVQPGLQARIPDASEPLWCQVKRDAWQNFKRATVEALADLVGAAGLTHPHELSPHHFFRRTSQEEYLTFAELYLSLDPGELLTGCKHERFGKAWQIATAESFQHSPPAW